MTVLEAPPVGPPTDLPAPSTAANHPGWSIVWRGKTWHESDLRGQHLSVMALLQGRDDFDMLDMHPGAGFYRLMSMITVFAAVDASDDAAPDEVDQKMALAIAEVADASAEKILGAFRF